MNDAANAEAEQVSVEQSAEQEKSGSGVRCVMCTAELDAKTARRKGGVTCPSNVRDCGLRYRRMRRELIEQTRSKCRSCGAPSNPKERDQFKQWRKAQAPPRGRRPRCQSPGE